MNFDPSGDNRETQNGMSSVRRPDTRNLDMFADVAVARRQREKEGFDSDAAGIREYQATMHWRGGTRFQLFIFETPAVIPNRQSGSTFLT